MISLLIKNLGIVLCCIYAYNRLLYVQIRRKDILLNFAEVILITSISTLLEIKYALWIFPTIILLTTLFLSYQYKRSVQMSFVCACFAYSFSYLSFYIAVFILSIYAIIYMDSIYTTLFQILTCIVQFILLKLIFTSKRLKKGVPFFNKPSYTTLGVIICSVILLVSMIMNKGNLSRPFFIIYLFTFIILFVLSIYWRNAINKTYIDELTKRTIQNLNEQLLNKNKAYEKLLADKERLSEIVHADKKLVSALEAAVVNRLESTEKNPEKDKELLDEIRRFSRERQGSIRETEKYLNPLPSCGIVAIDNVLSYMYQKAMSMNILITVSIDCDVKQESQDLMNTEDFSTLLADLLDNALIATRHNQGKYIFVSFSIVKKHFTIQVSDSGIPFTTEVLYKMGNMRITTHAEENGNGIGLMKAFEILTKANASLFIEEYDQTNGLYTKTLSIVFNRKKQYVLYTPRDEMEIAYLYQRPDLIVIHK